MRQFDLHPAPPVRIEIKYGKKDEKRGFPKKLDHLLVVERVKDKGRTANWHVCEDVHRAILGPEAPEGAKFRRVPIVLMSDSIEDCFPIFRSFFIKGQLLCSAKLGETEALRRYECDPETGKAVRKNGDLNTDVDPFIWSKCNASCDIWQASPLKRNGRPIGGCDLSGTLYFRLAPHLPRSTDFGALRIKGINAQKYMMSSLEILKRQTGGILANLPLEVAYHIEGKQAQDGKMYDIPLLVVQPSVDQISFMEAVEYEHARRQRHPEPTWLAEQVLDSIITREAFMSSDHDVEPESAEVAEEDNEDYPEGWKTLAPTIRHKLMEKADGDAEKLKQLTQQELNPLDL